MTENQMIEKTGNENPGPSWPREITMRLQDRIREEDSKGSAACLESVMDWLINTYIPELEEKYKRPLGDTRKEKLTNYLMYLADHKKFTPPKDAVLSIWHFANFVYKNYFINYPIVAITPRNKVIWICMLILGNGGREFEFGCDKFAEVISGYDKKKTYPMDICRTIRTFESAELIVTVRKGVRNGRGSIYRLAEKYHDSYMDIGSSPLWEGVKVFSPESLWNIFPWCIAEDE